MKQFDATEPVLPENRDRVLSLATLMLAAVLCFISPALLAQEPTEGSATSRPEEENSDVEDGSSALGSAAEPSDASVAASGSGETETAADGSGQAPQSILWGDNDPVQLLLTEVENAAQQVALEYAGFVAGQALAATSVEELNTPEPVEPAAEASGAAAVDEPESQPEPVLSVPAILDALAVLRREELAEALAAEQELAQSAERRAALVLIQAEDPSTAGLTLDELRSRRADIEILLSGRLPEDLTTENLFTANLNSTEDVTRRSRELGAEIAGKEAALELVSDALSADQIERANALLEFLAARKSFLDSPARTREAVLEAEVQAAALRIQQQEANVERQRAQAEAARAREAQEAALAEARAAANELDRRLATERARLERVRADLASFRVARSDEAAERAALLQERLDQTFEFQERVSHVSPATETATELYRSIRDESGRARRVLQEALQVAEADTGIPAFTLDETLVDNPDVSVERLEALRESENQLRVDIQTVQTNMAERRLSNVYEAAAYEKLVEELRLEVLQILPERDRAIELGFGRRGIQTLRGEVQRLGVMLNLSRFRASHLGSEFRDLYSVGTLVARLFVALLLLLVYLQLGRRGWPIQGALTNVLNRRARKSTAARYAAIAVGTLSGVYPELLLFVTVVLIGAVLGSTVQTPALALLYSLAFWYAGYRLTLSLVHRLLEWVALQGTLRVSDEFSGKLLASLAIVGRYVFIVGTILGVSEATLGRGYLYSLVNSFAWLGFFPIAFVLTQRWKEAIADAYLTLRGTGTLAELVRSSRDRRYGFAVAIIAFLVLAGVSIITALRSFAMGFEHSRRAVAYLFRRRIERHQTTSAVTAIELPPDLDAILTMDPKESGANVDEFDPAVARFKADFAEWLSSDRVGSFLIVSDIGLGKSSCMHLALKTAENVEQVSIHIPHRILDAGELVGDLARAFGVETDCTELDDLIAALLAGPRRLATIDNFERLFLRGVLSDGSMEAIERLVGETGHHVYWFCAIAVYPWEYLRWRKRAAMFREYFVIQRWKEVSIERMLRDRTAALGREVHYDSLFAGDVEGVSDSAGAANTISDIARLLWDYSDGSPAVAMYCWRHMLVPQSDGSLKVRLFPQKNSDTLEKLTEEEKFTLACVVWHTSISEEDTARALRYSSQTARDALRHLREIGIVARTGSMFHLTVDWTAPVLRYLRRKHLIS